VPWEVACDGNWLRGEQSTLTAWEKSAEGIVVQEVTIKGDWKRAPRGGKDSPDEGLNGSLRGD
jgi:hypothetical protein